MGNKTKSYFLFFSPGDITHPPPPSHLHIEEAISVKPNANQCGCYGNWGGGERGISSVFLSSLRETDLIIKQEEDPRSGETLFLFIIIC